jgi:hypothetical protein
MTWALRGGEQGADDPPHPSKQKEMPREKSKTCAKDRSVQIWILGEERITFKNRSELSNSHIMCRRLTSRSPCTTVARPCRRRSLVRRAERSL